jgi:hypothetical protein
MSENDDGSSWVDMVTGVLKEDRALPLNIQKRIANALKAEIVTRSQRPELLDAITISFPETKSGKPAVRIALQHPESLDKLDFLDNFIAETTEHYTATAFRKLVESGKVRVSRNDYPIGYHARCDSTIIAESTQDLIDAVTTMISNPSVKAEFSKTSPVAGIG